MRIRNDQKINVKIPIKWKQLKAAPRSRSNNLRLRQRSQFCGLSIGLLSAELDYCKADDIF